MRKNIVAGNWKMNLNREASVKLVTEISSEIQNFELNNTRVIVAPPFVNLIPVYDSGNKDSRIEVAAQNMHFAESGAYTGEVSAEMLNDIHIHTVILGHSERRDYFHEDDALLKLKIDKALEKNMEVIFCFGEKLEDRTSGNHKLIVESQIKNVLFHLDASAYKNIILAYEPVWAIGTGETASPEQAQEMHAFVRELLSKKYDTVLANSVSILYGGSVKPSNAKEIFSKPDVDGGLIGGAALNAIDFSAIVKAF